MLVHDTDLIGVVNELQNAGAEAISVNDQRIILNSAISCGGNIITVNGEKIGVPFIIKAIGLPEQLAGALERAEGYIDMLEDAGVRTSVEKTNNLTIPKYSGVINYKYLKSVE